MIEGRPSEQSNIPSREKLLEQYRPLTPLERNQVYLQLWQLIPSMRELDPLPDSAIASAVVSGTPLDRNTAFIERLVATMNRRDHSATFRTARARLSVLLSLAPITSSFSRAIVRDYSKMWLAVSPPTARAFHRDPQSPGADLAFTVDLATPNSTGLFDPDRARTLERQAYRQAVRLHGSLPPEYMAYGQGLIDGVKEAPPEHDGPLLSQPFPALQDEPVSLEDWRSELQHRYGTEP